jgi:selenocysteine lyase/cysteine desulfurase
MEQISKHTTWLAHTIFKRLVKPRHANGMSICHFYKASSSGYDDPKSQGATLALNFKSNDGTWLVCWHVGKMLREHGINVRTDSHCKTEQEVVDGKPVGMVCISFSTMSSVADIDAMATVIAESLTDKIEAGWSADRSTTCLRNGVIQRCRGVLTELLWNGI